MKSTLVAAWTSLFTLALAMLACSIAPQVPVTQPTRPGDILPTRATVLGSTAIPTAEATAQPRPTARQDTAAAALPSPDPKLIVITEDDISQAVGGGVGEDQGLKVQGVKVRFTADKMTLSAEELALGPLQVKNLVIVGTLYAQDGQLTFETESVSPGGLVTNMLPAVANRILSSYASRWYVEDVRIRDGRMELRIR